MNQERLVIDCGADPDPSSNWTLEEHQGDEKLVWDPAKVRLYLAQGQEDGRMKGYDLRKELKGQPVLNENVLNALFEHPQFIPEEWKGKYVFFWGTIYRTFHGLCVPYLYWTGDIWYREYDFLNHEWNAYDPAVVLVENLNLA